MVASPGTLEDHPEATVACPKKVNDKLSNGKLNVYVRHFVHFYQN
jgi:hypothetical protein